MGTIVAAHASPSYYDFIANCAYGGEGVQTCVWTGACSVAGCTGSCLPNLQPLSAYAALEDAAWSRDWYLVCPTVAQYVLAASLQAQAVEQGGTRRLHYAALPSRPDALTNGAHKLMSARSLQQAGAQLDLQDGIACPERGAITDAADTLALYATAWRDVFAAQAAGEQLSVDEQQQAYVLDQPHQFRLLASLFDAPGQLAAFVAANCTTVSLTRPLQPLYAPALPAQVSEGASLCRDNSMQLERHVACAPAVCFGVVYKVCHLSAELQLMTFCGKWVVYP